MFFADADALLIQEGEVVGVNPKDLALAIVWLPAAETLKETLNQIAHFSTAFTLRGYEVAITGDQMELLQRGHVPKHPHVVLGLEGVPEDCELADVLDWGQDLWMAGIRAIRIPRFHQGAVLDVSGSDYTFSCDLSECGLVADLRMLPYRAISGFGKVNGLALVTNEAFTRFGGIGTLTQELVLGKLLTPKIFFALTTSPERLCAGSDASLGIFYQQLGEMIRLTVAAERSLGEDAIPVGLGTGGWYYIRQVVDTQDALVQPLTLNRMDRLRLLLDSAPKGLLDLYLEGVFGRNLVAFLATACRWR